MKKKKVYTHTHTHTHTHTRHGRLGRRRYRQKKLYTSHHLHHIISEVHFQRAPLAGDVSISDLGGGVGGGGGGGGGGRGGGKEEVAAAARTQVSWASSRAMLSRFRR